MFFLLTSFTVSVSGQLREVFTIGKMLKGNAKNGFIYVPVLEVVRQCLGNAISRKIYDWYYTEVDMVM